MAIKLQQNKNDPARANVSSLFDRPHHSRKASCESHVDDSSTNQSGRLFCLALVSKIMGSEKDRTATALATKLTKPDPPSVSDVNGRTALGYACRREKLTGEQEHIPPRTMHATLRQCLNCKQLLNACLRFCVHCSGATKPPRSRQAMIAVKLACLLISLEMVSTSYASIDVPNDARPRVISLHFDH